MLWEGKNRWWGQGSDGLGGGGGSGAENLCRLSAHGPQGASMTARATCCTGGQRPPIAASCARPSASSTCTTISQSTTSG